MFDNIETVKFNSDEVNIDTGITVNLVANSMKNRQINNIMIMYIVQSCLDSLIILSPSHQLIISINITLQMRNR